MRTLKSVAIAITLVALATPAFAQPNGLRVNIPFEFRAADALLPAGTYHIAIDAVSNRIAVRSQGDASGILVCTHMGGRLGSEEQSSLLFHRYGNKYFLRLISTAGRSQGFALPRSSAEREVAKNSNRFTVALLPHSK
jgi:hypothetical protein